MVKSLVSALCALALLFGAAFYEQNYIKNTFDAFHVFLDEVYIKTEEETCTKEDASALQQFWINKKEVLHVWIPHNEIKEIDLWLAECVSFLDDKNYKEAKSKIEVVRELAEQIPKTFLIRAENIF